MHYVQYKEDSTGCVWVLQMAQEYVYRAQTHGVLGFAIPYLTGEKKKSLCMNGLEAAALALNPCSPMCFIFKAGNQGNVVLIFIKICFQNLF